MYEGAVCPNGRFVKLLYPFPRHVVVGAGVPKGPRDGGRQPPVTVKVRGLVRRFELPTIRSWASIPEDQPALVCPLLLPRVPPSCFARLLCVLSPQRGLIGLCI